jgi:hypothetical protein
MAKQSNHLQHRQCRDVIAGARNLIQKGPLQQAHLPGRAADCSEEQAQADPGPLRQAPLRALLLSQRHRRRLPRLPALRAPPIHLRPVLTPVQALTQAQADLREEEVEAAGERERLKRVLPAPARSLFSPYAKPEPRREGILAFGPCVLHEFCRCPLRGTGRLEIDAIKNAAQVMMHGHPMSAVRIARDGAALRLEPAEGLPSVRSCSGPWIKDLEETLVQPFEDRGPLWRITLWQEQDRFALVITFHHSIADGRSGVRFLLGLLSQMDTGKPPLPPVSPELQDRFASAAFEPKPPQPRADVLPWFAKRSGPSIPRLTRISMTESESSGIVRSAKKNSTTVHGLAGAAQLCALASLLDSKSARLALSTPADARTRLPAVKCSNSASP